MCIRAVHLSTAIMCVVDAASIEQRASGMLLQYASLPSLDKASPRISAYNTKLDDHDGALTRQVAPCTVNGATNSVLTD